MVGYAVRPHGSLKRAISREYRCLLWSESGAMGQMWDSEAVIPSGSEEEHPALVDRQFGLDGGHHYYIWEMPSAQSCIQSLPYSLLQALSPLRAHPSQPTH